MFWVILKVLGVAAGVLVMFGALVCVVSIEISDWWFPDDD